MTEAGLINGQQLAPWAGIPYGVSDVGHAGCEAIAVYNCMALTGRPRSFESVLDFFVRRFRTRRLGLSGWGRNGAWGAAPWDIAACLDALHVPYRRIRSLRGLEALSRAPGVFIVSYWNRPVTDGYHTVAIRRDGDRFLAYNRDCGSPSPAAATAVAGLLPGRGRFICGFFVPYPAEAKDL